MKVHLLVDVTLGHGHDDQPVKEVRQALVDHVEMATLWVGGVPRGEADGASAYDVTVLSFDVITP